MSNESERDQLRRQLAEEEARKAELQRRAIEAERERQDNVIKTTRKPPPRKGDNDE